MQGGFADLYRRTAAKKNTRKDIAMIIDFHTHIFPEKIAEKALAKLCGVIHLKPSMNGTMAGLLSSMQEAGMDIGVVLPTVTDPHQFDSILRFACYVNEYEYPKEGPRLLSLGGIHPDSADYKGQLSLLCEYGFRGFKIHPDYQETEFHDIRYKRILDKASELGLFCITHTGFDPYSPKHVHCSPEMIREVVEEVAPQNLVLAHMGGNHLYDQVEEHVLGLPVYLDTAYSIMNMDLEQFVRIVKRHGADKILFGTDVPWTNQKEALETFKKLDGLTNEEKQQILFENAAKLLRL